MTKTKRKCFTIAVISMISHSILIGFPTAVLIMTNNASKINSNINLHPICLKLTEYFGKCDETTRHVVTCTLLIVGVLGLVASVALILGLIREKTGFILVYLCYAVQISIFLLLGTLFALIQNYWYSAFTLMVTLGLCIYSAMVVVKRYEELAEVSVPMISDEQHLIEDEDLSTNGE